MAIVGVGLQLYGLGRFGYSMLGFRFGAWCSLVCTAGVVTQRPYPRSPVTYISGSCP